MNFAQMMKQAQSMKKDMEIAQQKLEAMEVEGVASAGAVKLVLSGKGVLKSVYIDPQLPRDEWLEDLIVVAHGSAMEQIEAARKKLLGPLSSLSALSL